MKKFEFYCFLVFISCSPLLIFFILGYGLAGGFWQAARDVGPALCIIWPPITCYMTLFALKDYKP